MSGLEVLGIAASVLQIADLGGKLSVKLFTFSRKIKHADKSIDSISQDIAATGAVLQQLGNELKRDEDLRLCSQEAISTARSLVNDCNKIFTELNEAIDGRGSGHKLVSGWKQKLKFPFLEAQIELLRSNLDRLKSSLLVMLNVLIFAEQLKNQKAVPLLEDQKELLRTLVEEKNINEKNFSRILKAIEGKSGSHETNITTQTTQVLAQGGLFVNLTANHSQSHAIPNNDVTLADDLPPAIANRKDELTDHCIMVNNILQEISAVQYRIDHGLRDRMQKGVLKVHWDEWGYFRKRHGHEALLKIFHMMKHNDIARYWARMSEDEIHEARHRSRIPSHFRARSPPGELAMPATRSTTIKAAGIASAAIGAAAATASSTMKSRESPEHITSSHSTGNPAPMTPEMPPKIPPFAFPPIARQASSDNPVSWSGIESFSSRKDADVDDFVPTLSNLHRPDRFSIPGSALSGMAANRTASRSRSRSRRESRSTGHYRGGIESREKDLRDLAVSSALEIVSRQPHNGRRLRSNSRKRGSNSGSGDEQYTRDERQSEVNLLNINIPENKQDIYANGKNLSSTIGTEDESYAIDDYFRSLRDSPRSEGVQVEQFANSEVDFAMTQSTPTGTRTAPPADVRTSRKDPPNFSHILQWRDERDLTPDLPSACDRCRRRQTRCNRITPMLCSACELSAEICTFAEVGKMMLVAEGGYDPSVLRPSTSSAFSPPVPDKDVEVRKGNILREQASGRTAVNKPRESEIQDFPSGPYAVGKIDCRPPPRSRPSISAAHNSGTDSLATTPVFHTAARAAARAARVEGTAKRREEQLEKEQLVQLRSEAERKDAMLRARAARVEGATKRREEQLEREQLVQLRREAERKDAMLRARAVTTTARPLSNRPPRPNNDAIIQGGVDGVFLSGMIERESRPYTPQPADRQRPPQLGFARFSLKKDQPEMEDFVSGELAPKKSRIQLGNPKALLKRERGRGSQGPEKAVPKISSSTLLGVTTFSSDFSQLENTPTSGRRSQSPVDFGYSRGDSFRRNEPESRATVYAPFAASEDKGKDKDRVLTDLLLQWTTISETELEMLTVGLGKS